MLQVLNANWSSQYSKLVFFGYWLLSRHLIRASFLLAFGCQISPINNNLARKWKKKILILPKNFESKKS